MDAIEAVACGVVSMVMDLDKGPLVDVILGEA